MCNSFKEQLPLAEITSSLSSEIISNVKFEVFDLKISSKNKIMFLKSYSTIRFNKILNVQIGYTDADKGQALISSFKNSIFTE